MQTTNIFENVPSTKLSYVNTKGKTKSLTVYTDLTAYGFLINAVNVAKNANRVKISKLNKSTGCTVPKKLISRDKTLTGCFVSLCANYTLPDSEKDSYIMHIYDRLSTDDAESYEIVSTALLSLYAQCTVTDISGGKSYILPDVDIIRNARSAVNEYLGSETKKADHEITFTDFLSDNENNFDKQTFSADFSDSANVSDSKLFGSAVCCILKQMRKIERIAIVTYGWQKSLYNRQGGGLKDSEKKTGYASIAKYLNTHVTADRLTTIYNADCPKNVKQSAQFQFNTAFVRHAVERFKKLFTAQFPQLVILISSDSTWSKLIPENTHRLLNGYAVKVNTAKITNSFIQFEEITNILEFLEEYDSRQTAHSYALRKTFADNYKF